MIFISDVHHQLEFLKLLPKKNEPVVILGDLINWIDYRNGEGIAKEVFGLENVQKLINLRKEHRFEERKNLWKSLYSDNPEVIMKNMRDAIENQYEEAQVHGGRHAAPPGPPHHLQDLRLAPDI